MKKLVEAHHPNPRIFFQIYTPLSREISKEPLSVASLTSSQETDGGSRERVHVRRERHASNFVTKHSTPIKGINN